MPSVPPFRLSWSRAVAALSLTLLVGGLWLRGEVTRRRAELEAQRERIERAQSRNRELMERLRHLQERRSPTIPPHPAPEVPPPGRGVAV